MREPANAETEQARCVRDILASSYGLDPREVVRLWTGQGTVNYRAVCQGQSYFVKLYQGGADPDAEAEAIALTQLAGRHGVPVAPLLLSTGGEAITRRGHTAVSVWVWVDGHAVTGGFTPGQQAAAGEALGRIHCAFAAHPASTAPSPELDSWLTPDLAGIEATVDKLLGIVADRPEHDEFDHAAEQTLAERRQVLDRVPDLLDGLPKLGTQVLHGDYSAVNLLFDGEHLAAVTDFRPPEPFLVAFELGRIAFDPRTVVINDDWITSASILVHSYLRANPNARAADVHACGRIALLQLLTSLYGVKNHYLKPGLLQDDLDAFWLLRHRASMRLLVELDEVEAMLGMATGREDSAVQR